MTRYYPALVRYTCYCLSAGPQAQVKLARVIRAGNNEAVCDQEEESHQQGRHVEDQGHGAWPGQCPAR